MRKAFILLLILPILLSSCATIFNGQYQRVDIKHNPGAEIYVDGKKPELTKKGKYKIKRDKKPKLITFQQEGYKDHQIIELVYGKSFISLFSLFPGAIFFMIPPIIDSSNNTFNYSWEISGEGSIKLPEKNVGPKNFLFEDISFDTENIKFNYYLEIYLGKKNIKRLQEDLVKHKKIKKETLISPIIKRLTSLHYIDSTKQNNSFIENLHIKASIKNINVSLSNYKYNKKYYTIYSALSIEWSILDTYCQLP